MRTCSSAGRSLWSALGFHGLSRSRASLRVSEGLIYSRHWRLCDIRSSSAVAAALRPTTTPQTAGCRRMMR
eukprot:scaffold56081_cov27-Tisochrysis_lutea.AAC.6